jgi:hypothetical protein
MHYTRIISFIMTMTNTINVRHVISRVSNRHIKGGGISVDKEVHRVKMHYTCTWSLIGSDPMFVSYGMNAILWYHVRHV